MEPGGSAAASSADRQELERRSGELFGVDQGTDMFAADHSEETVTHALALEREIGVAAGFVGPGQCPGLKLGPGGRRQLRPVGVFFAASLPLARFFRPLLAVVLGSLGVGLAFGFGSPVAFGLGDKIC